MLLSSQRVAGVLHITIHINSYSSVDFLIILLLERDHAEEDACIELLQRPLSMVAHVYP